VTPMIRPERHILIGLAAGGSAALLVTAFAFQHIGGMAPCALCLWQRWPHALAVLIGLVALALPKGAPVNRALTHAGALAAFATGAIGLYHTGVERGWWEGPSSCTSGPVSGLSPEALLDRIMTAPLVRCDEVPWQMLGLSMASWNTVLALMLGWLWLLAARGGAADSRLT